jgi:hypothetical protein
LGEDSRAAEITDSEVVPEPEPEDKRLSTVLAETAKKAKTSNHLSKYNRPAQDAILRLVDDLLPIAQAQEERVANVTRWAREGLELLEVAGTTDDLLGWLVQVQEHLAETPAVLRVADPAGALAALRAITITESSEYVPTIRLALDDVDSGVDQAGQRWGRFKGTIESHCCSCNAVITAGWKSGDLYVCSNHIEV